VQTSDKQFSVGLDVCTEKPHPVLSRSRFGLLMNQASVDRKLSYACDALADAYPSRLTTLFSPQHGFWGEQQANMIESPHARHPVLDIPVHSLYSETRRPTGEMLSNLDCLVIDLQDVGTRVYTFIWTVLHCLEACAEAGIPVVILDRPNPLGGELVEGPMLEPEFCSFVGRASIPMRHALTIAELARYLNEEMQIDAEIYLVPMQGWSRNQLWEQTNRVWIPPSPNLPTMQSVRVYPGQVLLEGTNLSEGRGTSTPFELVGAPFVDPFQLAAKLNRYDLPGVVFRPIRFLPAFDKWSGVSCGGVSMHVVEPRQFYPYRSSLQILATVKELWPDEFQWSNPPYEYESIKMPIDILSGSSDLRERLDSNHPLNAHDLDQLACADTNAWWNRIGRARLYPASPV
jgi:uncharacterized protein YbbC (DUF1343 family)